MSYYRNKNYFVIKAIKERKKRQEQSHHDPDDFCSGGCGIGKAYYFRVSRFKPKRFPTHESLCPRCHEKELNKK